MRRMEFLVNARGWSAALEAGLPGQGPGTAGLHRGPGPCRAARGEACTSQESDPTLTALSPSRSSFFISSGRPGCPRSGTQPCWTRRAGAGRAGRGGAGPAGRGQGVTVTPSASQYACRGSSVHEGGVVEGDGRRLPLPLLRQTAEGLGTQGVLSLLEERTMRGPRGHRENPKPLNR